MNTTPTTTNTPARDSRHTPGEWDVETKGSKHFVVGPDELTIAYLDRQGANKSREESEANARLIAAAPELLEALKEAVSFIGLKHGWNDQSYQTTDGRVIWFCADKARQAIAKAEGRT